MIRHQSTRLHRPAFAVVQRQATYLLLVLVAVVFGIAPLLHSAG